MATKQPVKALPFDQWTNWELHLFEQAVGYGFDALDQLQRSDKPKMMVYIAMMWIPLRRKLPGITLEEVGSGPYELEKAEKALDQLVSDAAEAESDPKDDAVETATETPGGQ